LIDIVIVGGGPTGVEVAGSLAEMKRYVLPKDYPELNTDEIDIYLIEGGDRLLGGMSEEAGRKALQFLEELGVKVQLSKRVTSFDGNVIQTNDGQEIPSQKVIWAAGIIGNRMLGLPDGAITRGNRIKVDRFHQVEGAEAIFAIGDIAYMEEENYPRGHPQVAQVAMQQAKHLAQYFKALKKPTKQLTPFKYKDLGSMATIGRNRAVVDLPKFKSLLGFWSSSRKLAIFWLDKTRKPEFSLS
jgi:NADH dehydrogenase